MIIVSDTSPISNLFIINRLDLLKKLYGKIIIPTSVMDELLELERRSFDLSKIKNASWFEVMKVKETEEVTNLLNEIALGEAEAIVLAKELHADLLLIDETDGRAIAKKYGLKIVGLLGVLLLAKEKKLITSVKENLDLLISKAKFRVSNDLYGRTLELAGE